MLKFLRICPETPTIGGKNRENTKEKRPLSVSNMPKKTAKRSKGKFPEHVSYNYLTILLNVEHKFSGSTSNYQWPKSDIISEQVKRRMPKKNNKSIGFTSRGIFSMNFTQYN